MDYRIVELLNERNEKGLELIEKKYKKYCMTILNGILKNENDSMECLNDVWLKLWNSIPPNKPKDLDAYIACVVRNCAFNYLKYQKAKKRGGSVEILSLNEIIITAKETAEEKIEVEELKRLINAYLSNQKKKKRIIFVLRYFYMLQIEEIASLLNINKKTISTILFRMRQELKEVLVKEGY